MKKMMTWFSLFIFSLVSVFSFNTIVEANEISLANQVTIQLKHESNSLEGTQFNVYGISKKDYQAALDKGLETSIEKTKQWLKENGISKAKEVLVSSSNQAIFTLPKYNEAKDLMYYVILQVNPDREGLNGEDIYESFPSFISLEEVDNNFLMIETKRVFFMTTPYFFKYSSGEEQVPLEGAEFVLYRLNDDQEKEYLTSIEPDIIWETGVMSDQAWTFKSDEQGLVVLPDLGLELGQYYFEETKAPEGYEITEESKHISLVISENEEDGLVIVVNGVRLTAFQAGELPAEIVEVGEPKILNNPKEIPPKEETPNPEVPKEETPKTDIPGKEIPPRKGFLPQTGESIWAFSGVGVVMMFIAYGLMKRRKENE